jgi:single-strand DNA-binding protein
MNKVILMGRLTKDPELRYSQAAEPVAIVRYTLAVNRRFKREGQPDADFINCVAFGKTGEFAEKYFKKGMMVAVSGSLQITSYDDPGGRKWFTDVIIDDQYFAESKSSFEQRNSGGQNFDYLTPPPASVANAARGNQAVDAGAGAPAASADSFYSIDESLEDEDLPF